MFTTIDHTVRNKFALTLNEYAICDSIYFLSRSKPCDAGKEYLGEFIGISRQSAHKIIIKLTKKNLIEKVIGGIKTTDLWNNEIEGLHSVKKVDTECKESLQHSVKKVDTECKESLHNIYNINTNNKDNILTPTLKHWNSKHNLTHHQDIIVKKYISKSNLILLETFGIDKVKDAIDNYDKVISNNDIYYFTHKWSLWEFIQRGLYRFVNDSKPLENFKKTKQATQTDDLDKYCAGYKK